MYRHMIIALFTYNLSSVSNLHLILGNLLLLVRLAVGPWPQAPSPWPWPWVPSPCFNITEHVTLLSFRKLWTSEVKY